MKNVQISQTIKSLRQQYQISQGTLAEALRVSTQTISKWETGKAFPAIEMMPVLAEFFHISIDALFYGISVEDGSHLEESVNQHLEENQRGWDLCNDANWVGTSLPVWGMYAPTEDQLCMLEDLKNKVVLELACGDGKSMVYAAQRGAKEIYGLDISEGQLKRAQHLLNSHGINAQLIHSPMEVNPNIPCNYFDCVYSVYGLGWSLDVDKVCSLVSKYLKRKGIFVFSWDNPFLPCLEAKDETYIQTKSYVDERPYYIMRWGHKFYMRNWKLSTYLNALADNGFMVEKVIEESDQYARNAMYSHGKYYSEHRAALMNHSVIIKARKI